MPKTRAALVRYVGLLAFAPGLFTPLIAAVSTAAEMIEIEILDWGVSKAPGGQRIPAPDTTAGTITLGVLPEMRQTDKVEACPGMRFGITFQLKGSAWQDDVSVSVEVSHPPFPGAIGKMKTLERWNVTAAAAPSGAGWIFEDDYELVSGKWTMSLVHEGRRLASHDFDVTARDECPLS